MKECAVIALVLAALSGCKRETRPNPFANLIPEVSGFDQAVESAREQAREEARKRAEEEAILKAVADSANSPS